MTTVTIRPDGAGDLTEQDPQPSGSVNWQNVDEETSDGDSTYNQNAYETLKILNDLYNLGSFSLPAGNVINSVTVYVVTRNVVSLYGETYTLIKTNGTVYAGTVWSGENTYTTISTIYTTNPATDSAWTEAEVNALQAGSRLTTEYWKAADAYTGGRTTQVYVVVDYSVPGIASKRLLVGVGL